MPWKVVYHRGMSETFYRLHHAAAPEFCAENAWSAQWGVTWASDGARYECTRCDGTGQDLTDPGEECPACDEGWQDADYGYSCCASAEELLSYMDAHGIVGDDDPVVIFEGQRVGTGGDGEPLAVPTGQVRWTTIGALRAEVGA